MRRLLFPLLLIALPGGAYADAYDPDAPTLRVVATQRLPKVERLLEELQSTLDVNVQVTDLRGAPRRAQRSIDDMLASIDQRDVILTLGGPAARLLLGAQVDNAVVCAMTSERLNGSGSPKIVHFSRGEPGVRAQIEALRMVWPAAGKVAVVVGADTPVDTDDLARAGLSALLARVDKEADLIPVLERLADDVDGFVFPRDPKVLNRRSIEEVVEWLAANRKAAIGYSKFLVRAGFPAAVAVDDQAVRRQVIETVAALLNETELPATALESSVMLNRDFVQHLGMSETGLPEGVELL